MSAGGVFKLEKVAGFPRLETERLVLRNLRSDDVPALFQNYSDQEITQYFFERPFSRLEQAQDIVRAFIQENEQGQGLTWAVTHKGDDTLIGTCGYQVESARCAEVGFDLAKTHWGQGLMSEAVRAVIRYGFEHVGFDEIKAHTYAKNVRAVRLLERVGLRVDETAGETPEEIAFVLTRE
jgi:ribosomal-protein-alanine N-acetyltransferase